MPEMCEFFRDIDTWILDIACNDPPHLKGECPELPRWQRRGGPIQNPDGEAEFLQYLRDKTGITDLNFLEKDRLKMYCEEIDPEGKISLFRLDEGVYKPVFENIPHPNPHPGR